MMLNIEVKFLVREASPPPPHWMKHCRLCVIILVELQGRARQLVSVGITTPQQLANTDPKSLCEMIEHLYPKQAKRMVNAAKVHA